ncbi:hypothetical protein ACF0H5_010046 [Mactra antiquata]
MRIIVFLIATQVVGCAAFWWSEPMIQPREDVSAECLNPPSDNPCLFYQCLERRFPCGANEYALKVGHHFCIKKNQHLPFFTPNGTKWLNETNICIRESLIPTYQLDETSCANIRTVGQNVMLDCINHRSDTGMDFCRFVGSNAAQYAELITIDDVSRLTSLGNPRIAARMIVNGAYCGGELLRNRLADLAGGFNDAVGSLLHIYQGLSSRWTNFWN